jgi:hypothetical protein
MREKAEASERRLVRLGVLPINIQHSTSNFQLLPSNYSLDVGRSMLDVRCFPAASCRAGDRRSKKMKSSAAAPGAFALV